MALIFADRVKQTTSTTGTGPVSLGGAISGFRTFSSGIGNANTCYYVIESFNGDDWEVGRGSLAVGAPDVLSRDAVLSSSNDGELVNFSAGIKTVFCTASAELLQRFTNGVEFIPLTTTQRNAIETPNEGLLIYNSTTKKLNLYAGAEWEVIGSTSDSIEISWISLTANGVSKETDTTQLTATFDVDPGLTTGNFVVTGASKGVVSKVGAVYTINIYGISVVDGENVSVQVINPAGYSITPTLRFVAVNVAEGDLVPRPSPFLGYSQLNTRAAVINEIIFQDGFNEDEFQRAPYFIHARLDLTVNGNRILSDLPIHKNCHGHVKWTLTFADDTPVPYLDEVKQVINAKTEDIREFNPFTDMVSPVFGVPIYKDGMYKLKAEVWFSAAGGLAVYASAEREFTVYPNNQNHVYFAGTEGSDTNDGRDPLGLALTDATYVEETGILSQSNGFTNYDHVAATSYGYDFDNTNWIYVEGQLRRIAEKIDNNSVRIDDAFKLGDDATGLTSSTGPKGYLTTQSDITNVVGSDDVYIHVSGDAASEIQGWITIRQFTGDWVFSGYGEGMAELSSLSRPVGSVLLEGNTTSSSSSYPTKTFIDNISIPHTGRQYRLCQQTFNNTQFSEDASRLYAVTRIKDYEGTGIAGLAQTPLGIIKRHCLIYANEVFGCGRSVRVISSMQEVTSSQSSISLTSPIDLTEYYESIPSGSNGRIKVYQYGYVDDDSLFTVYGFSTPEDVTNVTTLSIFAAGQGNPGTINNIAEGTRVEFVESKRILCLTSESYDGARTIILGNQVEWETDARVVDHYWYPTTKKFSLFGYNWMRKGRNVGYAFNHNIGTTTVEDPFGHSNVGNYISGCEYGFDSSSNQNRGENGQGFSQSYFADNHADDTLEGGMFYSFSLKSALIVKNTHYRKNTKGPVFFGGVSNTKDTSLYDLIPQEQMGIVLDRNDGYNYRLWENQAKRNVEAYGNNTISFEETNKVQIVLDNTDMIEGVIQAFSKNNMFVVGALNDSIFRINGTPTSLLNFESGVDEYTIAENNSVAYPDWVDGENGDFASNLTPVYTGVDNILLEPFVGEEFSVDLSQYFNGPDLTYTVQNGGLIDGLTLDGSIISGINTDGGGVFDLVIRATNEHGFADSSEIKLLARYPITQRMVTDSKVISYFDLNDYIILDEGVEIEFDLFIDRNASLAADPSRTNVHLIHKSGTGSEGLSLRIGEMNTGNATLRSGGSATIEAFVDENALIIGSLGNFRPFRDITSRMTMRLKKIAPSTTQMQRFLTNNLADISNHGASISNIRINPRTENEILIRVDSGGLDGDREYAVGRDDIWITYHNVSEDNWVTG